MSIFEKTHPGGLILSNETRKLLNLMYSYHQEGQKEEVKELILKEVKSKLRYHDELIELFLEANSEEFIKKISKLPKFIPDEEYLEEAKSIMSMHFQAFDQHFSVVVNSNGKDKGLQIRKNVGIKASMIAAEMNVSLENAQKFIESSGNGFIQYIVVPSLSNIHFDSKMGCTVKIEMEKTRKYLFNACVVYNVPKTAILKAESMDDFRFLIEHMTAVNAFAEKDPLLFF